MARAVVVLHTPPHPLCVFLHRPPRNSPTFLSLCVLDDEVRCVEPYLSLGDGVKLAGVVLLEELDPLLVVGEFFGDAALVGILRRNIIDLKQDVSMKNGWRGPGWGVENRGCGRELRTKEQKKRGWSRRRRKRGPRPSHDVTRTVSRNSFETK